MFKDLIDNGIVLYDLFFVFVGALLLYIYFTLYYHYIKAFPSASGNARSIITVFLTLILFQTLIALTLFISYVLMLFNGFQAESLIFPFSLVADWYEPLTRNGYALLVVPFIAGGFALISLIFMLNGLIEIIQVNRNRLKASGHLMVSMLLSLVPMLVYSFWEL